MNRSATDLPSVDAQCQHGPTPLAMRDALAAFPTGVAVVAAWVDARVVGLVANSFTSVSLDPALVSLSFARTSSTWPALEVAGHWGISVLGDGAGSRALLRTLSRPAGDRFRDVDVRVTDDGSVFLDDAIATFTVSMETQVEAGDHVLTILRVRDLWRDPGRTPLVFYDSAVHQLDPHFSGGDA